MLCLAVIIQVWHSLNSLLRPAGMDTTSFLKLHGWRVARSDNLCILVVKADLIVSGLGAV